MGGVDWSTADAVTKKTTAFLSPTKRVSRALRSPKSIGHNGLTAEARQTLPRINDRKEKKMPPHEHYKGRDDRLHDERLQQTWNGPIGVRRPHGPALGSANGNHGPHGRRHHPGLPPHLAGGGTFPPRSGMGGSGGDGFSGRAAEVLGTILPPEVSNWLLRSVSFGPPEIVAIFKVEIAAIAADLARRQAAGIEAPWFSPEDIQAGGDTLHAMSATMTDNEIAACLHNLFWGPDEVQAIAFLSLVVLRLIAADSAAQQEEA